MDPAVQPHPPSAGRQWPARCPVSSEGQSWQETPGRPSSAPHTPDTLSSHTTIREALQREAARAEPGLQISEQTCRTQHALEAQLRLGLPGSSRLSGLENIQEGERQRRLLRFLFRFNCGETDIERAIFTCPVLWHESIYTAGQPSLPTSRICSSSPNRSRVHASLTSPCPARQPWHPLLASLAPSGVWTPAGTRGVVLSRPTSCLLY